MPRLAWPEPLITPSLKRISTEPSPRIEPLITIGLGDVPRADLRIGYRGWIMTAGPGAKIEEGEAAMWGALLGSCLAARASIPLDARDIR